MTITLNTHAPAGGALVGLMSTDPTRLPVPLSVTIPAGRYSATFTLTSYYAGTPAPVTITAARNGDSVSAVLIVPPSGFRPPPPCKGRACQ